MSRIGVPTEQQTVLGLDRRLIWPTLGILAVVVLFAAVLPAIASSLDHDEPIEPGTVLDAGLGVTFTPADSWSIDLDNTGGTTTTLVQGAAIFSIRTGTWSGTLDEFIEEVNSEVEDRFDYRIHGGQSSVMTTQGVTGIGEAFLGAVEDGRLYGFVEDGVGVEVVASGPSGAVSARLDDVEAMVVSISFGEAGP